MSLLPGSQDRFPELYRSFQGTATFKCRLLSYSNWVTSFPPASLLQNHQFPMLEVDRGVRSEYSADHAVCSGTQICHAIPTLVFRLNTLVDTVLLRVGTVCQNIGFGDYLIGAVSPQPSTTISDVVLKSQRCQPLQQAAVPVRPPWPFWATHRWTIPPTRRRPRVRPLRFAAVAMLGCDPRSLLDACAARRSPFAMRKS